MANTIDPQKWYSPIELGAIGAIFGKTDPNFYRRLIKEGKLKAKNSSNATFQRGNRYVILGQDVINYQK